MVDFDTPQICKKGHIITDSYYTSPDSREKRCHLCGAETTHVCHKCEAELPAIHYDSNNAPVIPQFCKECGEAFPWAKESGTGDQSNCTMKNGIDPNEGEINVRCICNRFFHLVVGLTKVKVHAGVKKLEISNEYDVQYLLGGLLRFFFDDVRPEEYTPSYAGKSARMDFLVKEESIVVEAKMTREGLGEGEIGDQLIIDIGRYRVHQNCKKLFCFIYDPDSRITNPKGLEADLSGVRDGLNVEVIVCPRR